MPCIKNRKVLSYGFLRKRCRYITAVTLRCAACLDEVAAEVNHCNLKSNKHHLF